MPDGRVVALLAELVHEVRGLRRDMRRRDCEDALEAALRDEFNGGGFTVAGLLEIVASEPESALARVLADVVDLDAPERSRSTALGRLLGRLPGIQQHGERRGSALYRVADFAGEVRSPRVAMP